LVALAIWTFVWLDNLYRNNKVLLLISVFFILSSFSYLFLDNNLSPYPTETALLPDIIPQDTSHTAMTMGLAAGSPSSFIAAVKSLIDRIFPPESGQSVNSLDQSIQESVDINLPSDKTDDLDLICIQRGTQILCESPTFLEDMIITQPAYMKIKTPHTVKNIDKKSVHLKTLDIIEEFESKTIKLNKTKNLAFEIPLISYGSMEIKVDGKTRTINFSSYLSEETTFSEDETGKKLKITKTQKGWTQDYKIFSDHALYNNNEIIFSADVDAPQNIDVSLEFPADSTVQLGTFYRWANDSWIESDYALYVDSPTYFKQEYDWFEIDRPYVKFNISIVGDNGFSALMDPDISACSTLSTAGATYTLTTDITDSGASLCMNISANDVTLDCQGNMIDANGFTGVTGIGVLRASSTDTNVTIKNCVVSDWDSYGIHLSYANQTNITNTTINSNWRGIYLIDSSSRNNLVNITADSNSVAFYIGSDASYNDLVNITADSNSWGVFFDDSTFNNITNSVFDSSVQYGVRLDGSHNNSMRDSRVSNSAIYGIYIEYGASSNNFYNNLFNNTDNVEFSGTIAINYWNTTKQTGTRIYGEGTQIGGNYWTDPDGNYSDTCTDSDEDGFCDNSYTLETNNIDYLPLSDISMCMALSTSDTVYTLITNVSSDATCFTIEADNITLDCDGYTINYSKSSVGYAINNSGGYDNLTIKNCNIFTDATDMYAYAIYTSGMEDSTITNNTINVSNPSGFFQYGIFFDSSSSNTISDNTVTTYGAADHAIRIESSSHSNNISSNILIIEGSMLTGGLYIVSSNDSYISSNNITASGSNYALWLDEAYNNRIYDTFLDAYTSSDIRVEETSKNYLINCTFNQSDIYFIASPTLEIQWYLDIYVNDSSGSSLEDANVTAWQSNGTEAFSNITDAQGNIQRHILTEYTHTPSGKDYTDYVNYTVNARHKKLI